jgi:lipoprotein-releasing system ATP-binding protein
MRSADAEVLRLADVHKSYNVGLPTQVEVLHGVDLTIERGEFAALIGPSGSGKSTLLNLIGLLDAPTGGELYVRGEPTSTLDDARRTALRGAAIGFVFQFHHLIQAFTALENVLLPLMLKHGKPDAAARAHGRELLAAVGLAGLDGRRPNELSGGQQQRVAIARALVTRRDSARRRADGESRQPHCSRRIRAAPPFQRRVRLRHSDRDARPAAVGPLRPHGHADRWAHRRTMTTRNPSARG